MENLAPVVTDHKEAVQYSECQRGHGEEVHRRDGVAMIAKKDQPPPGWIRILARTFDPARYRLFRNVESQLEQLSVDARCSSRRVLRDHAENQVAHFPAQGFPPGRAAISGKPNPIQPEAGAIPTHRRLRGHQDQ